MHFLHFLWPINYNHASQCNKSFTHSLSIWFWLKISCPFFEIMASHMATSYQLQIAQANEKPAPKSSLNLTLTQHPCDENLEPQEVRACLEVNPPWIWYYHISPNFCTLVILLQITSLLVMNLKPFVKVVTRLKTLLSSHGLQFMALDIIIGSAIRFFNYLLIARQTT